MLSCGNNSRQTNLSDGQKETPPWRQPKQWTPSCRFLLLLSYPASFLTSFSPFGFLTTPADPSHSLRMIINIPLIMTPFPKIVILNGRKNALWEKRETATWHRVKNLSPWMTPYQLPAYTLQFLSSDDFLKIYAAAPSAIFTPWWAAPSTVSSFQRMLLFCLLSLSS